MPDTSDTEERVPLSEERISLQKRTVETGRVRVRTVIQEREHWVRESLEREEVLVKRVPIDREIGSIPPIREEGDTLVIPLVEEVLVLEKRLVLREEIHLQRQHATDILEAPVTLRSMQAVVERDAPGDQARAENNPT